MKSLRRTPYWNLQYSRMKYFRHFITRTNKAVNVDVSRARERGRYNAIWQMYVSGNMSWRIVRFKTVQCVHNAERSAQVLCDVSSAIIRAVHVYWTVLDLYGISCRLLTVFCSSFFQPKVPKFPWAWPLPTQPCNPPIVFLTSSCAW